MATRPAPEQGACGPVSIQHIALVLEASGLCAQEKAILIAFCNHTDASGKTFAGEQRLMREAGMSRTTFQTWRAKLVTRKLIFSRNKGRQGGGRTTSDTWVNLSLLREMRDEFFGAKAADRPDDENPFASEGNGPVDGAKGGKAAGRSNGPAYGAEGGKASGNGPVDGAFNGPAHGATQARPTGPRTVSEPSGTTLKNSPPDPPEGGRSADADESETGGAPSIAEISGPGIAVAYDKPQQDDLMAGPRDMDAPDPRMEEEHDVRAHRSDELYRMWCDAVYSGSLSMAVPPPAVPRQRRSR